MYDAIERWGREKGIDTVMVRHEQAGGHAADAWARATGTLGVCLGTAGPGVTHLVPAVAAAWADSIPLLVIGAQIARMFDDTGILQGGLDQVKLMEPITKLQISVEEPYEIPKAVQKAIKVATSGRNGPVFLELRETALVREAKDEYFKEIVPPEEYRPKFRPSANPKAIEEAVAVLKEAKMPLIIAGGGAIASAASKELKMLSEVYSIPIGTTINGIGTASVDLKTYIGSYLTANAFRTAASKADVILSFGAKWDYTLLYGAPPIWNQDQKLIQIDIDPQEIGKNRPIKVGIVGDVKAVVNQLLEKIEEKLPKKKITEWTEWTDFLKQFFENDKLNIDKILKSDKLPMKPQKLVYEILDFITPETQLVLDGGDIVVFTFGLISQFKRFPRSVFYPINFGHLGVCIPYCIGVKMAKPKKDVVCITGDGSFMFNVQELETAVRLNIPFVIVIANNSCWGMIKSNQRNNLKKRYCDVDFPSTDYAKIAKGYGCYAEKISNPDDIQPAKDIEKLEKEFDIPCKFVDISNPV
ncbi:MAG: thiamine pyrophosphate-binding protein [Candidatus Lokiarchaeota archaeon]